VPCVIEEADDVVYVGRPDFVEIVILFISKFFAYICFLIFIAFCTADAGGIMLLPSELDDTAPLTFLAPFTATPAALNVA